MIRLLVMLSMFVVTAPTSAEDFYRTTGIPLEIPRKKPSVVGNPALDRVEYGIWIPDEARPVRGLMFNPFGPAERSGPPEKHWHEACRLWRFALVTANYDGVNRQEFAATFRAALQEFARQSGRTELNHAPFVVAGMSRGGGYSRAFALEFPERAVAVAPVCLEAPPDEPSLRGIPFLTVFGEKDGGQMQKIMTAHPLRRGEGAQWCVAVQWGRGHEFAKANNVVIPFFDAVIHRRLPAASAESSKLLKYPAEEVWFGDANSWNEKRRIGRIQRASDFRGDPSTQAWLPDERTARAWQAFVSADKAVKIVDPPGLGDGQPFVAHSPNTPVNVRVVVKSPAAVKISLYDGERRIAEQEGLEAVFTPSFEPGIHPLYSVVRTADGVERFSFPHTLIVRERVKP